MIIFKTDNRGRTTNKIVGDRMKKAVGIPRGVGYCVPMPGHMLRSPAWMVLPLRARQAIDGIMSEYAEHGGNTNGELIMPYNQLASRMRRSSIKEGLVILEALGLIKADRDTRSVGTMKRPTLYRLTWLGTPDGLSPTHEWKSVKTEEDAHARITNALEKLYRERAAALKMKKMRKAREVSVAHHQEQADAA
jgi:hypothetical protein